MNLEDVKGVGPSAARKLEAAGIDTVEQLSEVDLRGEEIEGLSPENIARLRENARALLEAARTGDLKLVDGLGPSAERKLAAVGVKTIGDLVELDLRSTDVEGLSTENLQKLKQNASFLVPSS